MFFFKNDIVVVVVFNLFILLFIWLHWVFVAELGATLKLWCAAFSSTVGGFSCYGSRALGSRASIVATSGLGSGARA